MEQEKQIEHGRRSNCFASCPILRLFSYYIGLIVLKRCWQSKQVFRVCHVRVCISSVDSSLERLCFYQFCDCFRTVGLTVLKRLRLLDPILSRGTRIEQLLSRTVSGKTVCVHWWVWTMFFFFFKINWSVIGVESLAYLVDRESTHTATRRHLPPYASGTL